MICWNFIEGMLGKVIIDQMNLFMQKDFAFKSSFRGKFILWRKFNLHSSSTLVRVRMLSVVIFQKDPNWEKDCEYISFYNKTLFPSKMQFYHRHDYIFIERVMTLKFSGPFYYFHNVPTLLFFLLYSLRLCGQTRWLLVYQWV